ncbi:MAG: hypothetical protein GEV11_01600 [Streptosporangiales bacterium]|nr:hypothetical protein [Streptosporangiales bacterium]
MGTFIVLKARSVRVLRVSRRELGGAALVGLLLPAGGQGLVTIGEQWLPSSIAALLIASVPLWLVVFRTGRAARSRRDLVSGVGLVVTTERTARAPSPIETPEPVRT